MPELPEVETIRRQLAERLPGRSVAAVRVLDPLLTAPEDPRDFRRALVGQRVCAVGRRGKYLLVELESGDTLALHLRMTGQLHWSLRAGRVRERFHRARFSMDDGSTLDFCDMRRFGRAWLVAGDLPDRDRYWDARAGFEPLNRAFTARRLAEILAGRRGPIKGVLLNQRLVAGIGNIYADEALFQAGIHPLAPGGSLDKDQVRRLHRAIRDRLRAAVAAGGSSIDRYRDTTNRQGAMQDLLRVHLHEGDPCPRCGTTVEKTRVAQRGTYLCPRCQPAPVA